MPKRTAKASWSGKLKDGCGSMQLPGSDFKGGYSFSSRFEQGRGTNPENISTEAKVSIEPAGEGFKIGTVELMTEGKVPKLEEDEFVKYARQAKDGCPVSMALKGVEIKLEAKLVS